MLVIIVQDNNMVDHRIEVVDSLDLLVVELILLYVIVRFLIE